MRILFATPSYWPSTAYGGPISKMRELASGLVRQGHTVEVVTTSLVDLGTRPARATRTAVVDGAHVTYVATPMRYRWMGITPSLGRHLADSEPPDILHIFGYRDYVGTVAARWARKRKVPYVFEGLGMVQPRLRKVVLKQSLDATLFRSVIDGASLLVAASALEADEYALSGVDKGRVTVRPNGFPDPIPSVERPGPLRLRLGLDPSVPLILALGRVTRGKGLELLVGALQEIEGAHLAIVGPDDRRGLREELEALGRKTAVTGRLHITGAWNEDSILGVCSDADVCVLASEGENFGMAAAEAAAAGTAAVVTDRCGVAELLRDRCALIVPFETSAITEAIRCLLADDALCRELGNNGRAVASEWSWAHVVELQERLYERVLDRG